MSKLTNELNHFVLDPADVLFFRSGSSFDAGDDNYVASVFPPAPSVLYGALQSVAYDPALPLQNQSTNPAYFPDPTLITHSIALRLHRGSEAVKLLYPMPVDLIPVYDEQSNIIVANALGLQSVSDKVAAGIENEYLLLPQNNPYAYNEGRKINKQDLYIDRDGLLAYVEGRLPDTIYDIKNCIASEMRTGIGRKIGNRTVSEGLLYRMELIRMQLGLAQEESSRLSFSILCSTDSQVYQNLNITTIKLGGERKLAQLYKSDLIDAISSIQGLTNGDRLKAYFTTPIAPKDESTLTDYWRSIGCSFLTYCTEREQFLGGWDIQKVSPKPTYKCIPAGSVYFLEVDDAEKFMSAYNPNPVGAMLVDKAFQVNDVHPSCGFGLYYISKMITI